MVAPNSSTPACRRLALVHRQICSACTSEHLHARASGERLHIAAPSTDISHIHAAFESWPVSMPMAAVMSRPPWLHTLSTSNLKLTTPSSLKKFLNAQPHKRLLWESFDHRISNPIDAPVSSATGSRKDYAV